MDSTSILRPGTLCFLHLPTTVDLVFPNDGRVVEVVRFLGHNELFRNGRCDSYEVVSPGTLQGFVPAFDEQITVPPGEHIRAPRRMLHPFYEPPLEDQSASEQGFTPYYPMRTD